MSSGEAVLVGLTYCDESVPEYRGWNSAGGCAGCEKDVDSIQGILTPLDFAVKSYTTEVATADNVLEALNIAAGRMESGDLFVFYYSGHGGRKKDLSGDERQKNGKDLHDETLCLYDRQLLDDELAEIWPKFSSGVRLVMMSDSCNSGSNFEREVVKVQKPRKPINTMSTGEDGDFHGQMIHMGGCRDGESSKGFKDGGAFTLALLDAWDDGRYLGTYADLFEAIKSGVNTGQEPQFSRHGNVSASFLSQRPFTI